MAYITTPDLGLELADPTTIQAFETTNVNSNFLLLEAGIVADRVRISAEETKSATLLAGAGRGTIAQYTVASLAALDAISTAVVGDEAVFSAAPSTGIAFEGLKAQAISGSGSTIDWRFTSPIEAATKANLDTFIAAVVAISDLATGFKLGGLAYISGTRQFVRFTSTAGAYNYLDGLVPILPTSVAGTGVTVAANGRVSFSASTTISVNGCFTSDFDTYLLIMRSTNGGAGLKQFRLRLAGTDASAATTYDDQRITGIGTTAAAANGSNAQWGSFATTPYQQTFTRMELSGPALATPTMALGSMYETNYIGNMGLASWGGVHRTATAYDGISVIPGASSETGYLTIYGYNNN